MSDQEILDRAERAATSVELPDDRYEDLLGRRDRRHRRQRIRAAAVGFAIFVAAVWIVTSGGPSERSQTPVAPGEVGTTGSVQTGPRGVTGPADPPGVMTRGDYEEEALVGLPPADAEPSAPVRGTLVLSYHGRPTVLGRDSPWYALFVYEDGRVIWDHVESNPDLPLAASGFSTGWIEQRLTPEGVQLLLDEARSSGLLEDALRLISGHGYRWGWITFYGDKGRGRLMWHTPVTRSWIRGDPDRWEEATPEQAAALEQLTTRLADLDVWVPEHAWADPTPRAYVASRYQVCVYVEDPTNPPPDNDLPPPVDPTEIVALLPQKAQRILAEHGDGFTQDGSYGCYVLALDRARELSEVLADDDRWGPGTFYFSTPTPEFDWPIASVVIDPILPHDETTGGG